MKFENLYDTLDDFWKQVVNDLIQSLKDVDRYASGNTAQSIGEFNTKPVEIVSNGFKITLGMFPYYEFMDEGVSGAKNNKGISRFSYKDKGKGRGGRGQRGIPPIKPIRDFMFNRTIATANLEKLKRGNRAQRQQNIEDAQNSIAFAISYKIWRDGLKPTNFYSNVVNDALIDKFAQQILNKYSDLVFDIIVIND
jgi:hypothetical protein